MLAELAVFPVVAGSRGPTIECTGILKFGETDGSRHTTIRVIRLARVARLLPKGLAAARHRGGTDGCGGGHPEIDGLYEHCRLAASGRFVYGLHPDGHICNSRNLEGPECK